MMKLSKRLMTVAELIPASAAVLDIGCDHAYVPLYVVGNGTCPCAIASDLRPGPLEAAKEHIAEAGLSDRILTVCADGVPADWHERLSALLMKAPAGKAEAQPVRDAPYPAVCAVTAGMGGLLMRDIFRAAADRENIRYWVASPQRDADVVRNTFAEYGFEIRDERFLTEDGKYYPVILAEQTGKQYVLSRPEALYGPVLLRRRDALLRAWLARRKTQLESILSRLPSERTQRRDEILEEISSISRATGDML